MSFFRALIDHPIYILLIYLLIINLVLFAAMALDKSLAKREKRRIAESTLFLLCVIGGSIGGICGMLAFRHKTKHAQFKLGFPLILILQLALAGFIIYLINK